ncbi:hypothetical protein [Paenibacillus odorifer]|uniref:hypothetical protein n=1 Tax=Paenibacillus odorifer TaxID=189426 RepID=UPI00096FF54A|nr:hypothetical protein [Paenibacillus odorifer]OMD76844.1 hypothetical protein BSK50_13915 [Paenibacillus odorifer]
MAERLLKCPVCGQYGHKANMIREEDKRYYHLEYCHDKWKKDKEATKIENQQWDDLYQYIINLHDVIVLPKGNITRLKDLRAGFITKDGKRIRQYRTGPDYTLMLEAYQLTENSIKWCIVNKLDGSSDTKAINYGLSMMIGKLNEAFARRKNRSRQLEQIEIDKESKNTYDLDIKYVTKKATSNDISDFL